MEIIQVEPLNLDGTTKNYPYNEAAYLLCHLTGTKTLSREALITAMKLGHEIYEIHSSLKK